MKCVNLVLTYFMLSAVFLNLLNVQCSSWKSDHLKRLLQSSGELQSLTSKRSILVDDLWNLMTTLDEKIEEYGSDFHGKETDILVLIRELSIKWDDIEKVSNQIFQLIPSKENGAERDSEQEYFRRIKNDYAGNLFRAKARKCESAFETFHKPQEKCLPIADQSGGPCPTNQLLYDIDGINEGVCDCNTNMEFVFYEQTESCYQLNTEGPCNSSEWIVLKLNKYGNETIPECEAIPNGFCPADGKHVFHEENCWELGTRGPCKEGQVIMRNHEDWTSITCVTDSTNAGFSFGNQFKYFPCPHGSRRSQNGQCKPTYYPGKC